MSEAETRSVEFEQAAVESVLGGYQTLPGVRDEMMDADGQPRAHWTGFLGALAELGPEELRRRFSSADRYLGESGVFYRVYDDAAGASGRGRSAIFPCCWKNPTGRNWPRPRGAGRTAGSLAGGSLWPRQSRLAGRAAGGGGGWQPGIPAPHGGGEAPGRAFPALLCGGCGPWSGRRWWVLSDRTQAPSGVGYALENRLAVTRALPDISRSLRMERLASFFQSFRTSLLKLDSTARAALAC